MRAALGLACIAVWMASSVPLEAAQTDPALIAARADPQRMVCRRINLHGSHIKRTVCQESWRWEAEKRHGERIVEMLGDRHRLRHIPTGSGLR